jgi:hypothetical protein
MKRTMTEITFALVQPTLHCVTGTLQTREKVTSIRKRQKYGHSGELLTDVFEKALSPTGRLTDILSYINALLRLTTHLKLSVQKSQPDAEQSSSIYRRTRFGLKTHGS